MDVCESLSDEEVDDVDVAVKEICETDAVDVPDPVRVGYDAVAEGVEQPDGTSETVATDLDCDGEADREVVTV